MHRFSTHHSLSNHCHHSYHHLSHCSRLNCHHCLAPPPPQIIVVEQNHVLACVYVCLVGKSIQNSAESHNYSDSGPFELRNFHRNFIFPILKCVCSCQYGTRSLWFGILSHPQFFQFHELENISAIRVFLARHKDI